MTRTYCKHSAINVFCIFEIKRVTIWWYSYVVVTILFIHRNNCQCCWFLLYGLFCCAVMYTEASISNLVISITHWKQMETTHNKATQHTRLWRIRIEIRPIDRGIWEVILRKADRQTILSTLIGECNTLCTLRTHSVDIKIKQAYCNRYKYYLCLWLLNQQYFSRGSKNICSELLKCTATVFLHEPPDIRNKQNLVSLMRYNIPFEGVKYISAKSTTRQQT